MNYTLMHKDIPVLGIALDDGGTKITRVGELYHGEDLPVGVPITWDKADRAALNAWWTDRFIPSARSGFSTSFLESRMIQKLKSRKSRIKPGLFAFLLAERIIFGKKTHEGLTKKMSTLFS